MTMWVGWVKVSLHFTACCFNKFSPMYCTDITNNKSWNDPQGVCVLLMIFWQLVLPQNTPTHKHSTTHTRKHNTNAHTQVHQHTQTVHTQTHTHTRLQISTCYFLIYIFQWAAETKLSDKVHSRVIRYVYYWKLYMIHAFSLTWNLVMGR